MLFPSWPPRQCEWTGPSVLLHPHIEGNNDVGLCPELGGRHSWWK